MNKFVDINKAKSWLINGIEYASLEGAEDYKETMGLNEDIVGLYPLTDFTEKDRASLQSIYETWFMTSNDPVVFANSILRKAQGD